MATEPTELQAFERQYGPFTHMSAHERAIWTRWLRQGGGQFAPFHYDIRVGNGLQMPAGSSGYAVRSAYALTTKRIDALFRRGDTTTIIEVKPRAGLSAIGQLIGYRDLYRQTPDFPERLICC